MDNSREKPTGAGAEPYIWLRYTTQFTTAGRSHTIEMGIPVPLGASAERREQLIREAEMGMDQLSRRIENRVTQMQQRNSRPYETGRPQEQPLPQESGNRSPAASAYSQSASSASGGPASLEEKQTATLPVQATRQTVGASMPSTPGIPGDVNSIMKLSQFMQFIRETWGLTPKQAMEMLNLKTLNGLNYREILRQLQPLVEKDANGPAASDKKPPVLSQMHPANPPASAPIRSTSNQPAQPATSIPPASSTPVARPAPATPSPPKAPVIPIHVVRDDARVYKFDEEVEGMEDEKEIDIENDDREQQMAMARIKLDELKEVRGPSTANPARLTALQNVLNSQISDAQLQHLIQTIWGATTVKKLKVDQVEALISWAKEDYFVDEVEAVLALIDEEESYARSDW